MKKVVLLSVLLAGMLSLWKSSITWKKATQVEFGEDGMEKDHVRERAEIEVEPIETSSTRTVYKDTVNEGDLLKV